MIKNFPSEFKPKKSQIELINEIGSAFTRKKFVIVSAPTGTGKSFLSATLANSSDAPSGEFKRLVNSYEAYAQNENGGYDREDDLFEEPPFGGFVLTITKALQDQYLSLFKDCKVFKGKSNYMCNVDQHSDVEIAPCMMLSKMKEDCWKKNFCSYYNARNEALTSQFTALNYKIFFTVPDHLKRKNYIICDEASELEDELVKRFSRNLNYKILKRLGFSPKDIPVENYKKFRVIKST